MFPLGAVGLHSGACAQCWLVGRHTPMQLRGLSAEELQREGGRFTAQQLRQARDRVVAALQRRSPAQHLFQIDLREDTDEQVQKDVYCSESEITQVAAEEAPENCFFQPDLRDACQSLQRQLQASQGEVRNVSGLLQQQRQQDQQLREANLRLQARVRQLQETVDALADQQPAPGRAADQAYQQQIGALQQQIQYLSDQQAEHDRQQAVEEAKVRYLVRLVQNLQAGQGRAPRDGPPGEPRLARAIHESMAQESVAGQSLQVQQQIEAINRRLADSAASLLLSHQQPAAGEPAPARPPRVGFADQTGAREAVSCQQASQRVSAALDEVRGRPAPRDIHGLRREIMKNSVRRQQRRDMDLTSYGLEQKLAEIQRRKQQVLGAQ